MTRPSVSSVISSPLMTRRVCRVSAARVVALAVVLATGPALALVVGVVLVGGLAGCGPIVYVAEVSRHASASVDAARAAHAEQYAPYWWTRATEYLEQAREVAAHADFQGANRFGRLAAEAADKATEEALIAARGPTNRPTNRALEKNPYLTPTKDPASPATPPPRAVPAKDPAPPARASPAKDPAPKRTAPAPGKDAP